MTTESMLVTAIVSLAGAVSTLFGVYIKDSKYIRQQLDDCIKDREKLWVESRKSAQENTKLWQALAETKDLLINKLTQ